MQKCCAEEKKEKDRSRGDPNGEKKKRSNIAAVVVIVASFAFAFECPERGGRAGREDMPHTVKINIFARFGYSQNLCKFRALRETQRKL